AIRGSAGVVSASSEKVKPDEKQMRGLWGGKPER
ncbi:MAG: hypothetical protein RIS70_921, partial [Planctomycetota bacterium]